MLGGRVCFHLRILLDFAHLFSATRAQGENKSRALSQNLPISQTLSKEQPMTPDFIALQFRPQIIIHRNVRHSPSIGVASPDTRAGGHE